MTAAPPAVLDSDRPWARPPEEVLRAVDSSAEGLAQAEVDTRLAQTGPN
ncbi:MAG TPA: hypothetical protein DHV14_13635, partial [Micrococcales bacterium]|nr:hypothetical protein [Micrococcales bacterium]